MPEPVWREGETPYLRRSLLLGLHLGAALVSRSSHRPFCSPRPSATRLLSLKCPHFVLGVDAHLPNALQLGEHLVAANCVTLEMRNGAESCAVGIGTPFREAEEVNEAQGTSKVK